MVIPNPGTYGPTGNEATAPRSHHGPWNYVRRINCFASPMPRGGKVFFFKNDGGLKSILLKKRCKNMMGGIKKTVKLVSQSYGIVIP